MKITEFSVKNPQFTIIMFVLIIAIGINALLKMPKAEDPVLKATYNSIVVVYPGTSPEDIEKLILDPLEERMSGISEIKKIVSTAGDGVGVVTVEFEHAADENEKANEVLRELNAIRNKLPPDIYSIDVNHYTPETVNIFQGAFVSETASYQQLNSLAEDLKSKILKIKNIRDVNIWGAPQRVINVTIDVHKLAQIKLPLSRIISIVQSENGNIPAGEIEINNRKLNVKTSGAYKSLEEISNTVVSSSGQNITMLKDVAEVNYDLLEQNYITRQNKQRGIFITATLKKQTNIFEVDAKLSPLIEQFKDQMPENVKLIKSFDQAASVSKRLVGLSHDFIIAIVLVLITLIPLGLRASIIVMLSIPLSLAIGLTCLDLLGYGINQLSVVGLVISLGLRVDDSIVVVENISRFIREGHNRIDAAIKATSQISLAVVGCTATLIFAFLPLTFLPESSGEFVRGLPIAVITTVTASLIVSLTIVPFLASLLMPKTEKEEGNAILKLLNQGIEASYKKILHWALENPYKTLSGAAMVFVISLILLKIIGLSVFPKSEKPQFLINIEMPLGTALGLTDAAAKFVENELSKEPDIKNYGKAQLNYVG